MKFCLVSPLKMFRDHNRFTDINRVIPRFLPDEDYSEYYRDHSKPSVLSDDEHVLGIRALTTIATRMGIEEVVLYDPINNYLHKEYVRDNGLQVRYQAVIDYPEQLKHIPDYISSIAIRPSDDQYRLIKESELPVHCIGQFDIPQKLKELGVASLTTRGPIKVHTVDYYNYSGHVNIFDEKIKKYIKDIYGSVPTVNINGHKKVREYDQAEKILNAVCNISGVAITDLVDRGGNKIIFAARNLAVFMLRYFNYDYEQIAGYFVHQIKSLQLMETKAAEQATLDDQIERVLNELDSQTSIG